MRDTELAANMAEVAIKFNERIGRCEVPPPSASAIRCGPAGFGAASCDAPGASNYCAPTAVPAALVSFGPEKARKLRQEPVVSVQRPVLQTREPE